MEDEKKLGLRNVVSVSVGLVIATSSLVQLGQGAGEVGVLFVVPMIIACILNMITMLTMSELNALMPDVTGGLAQYTLAGLGPVPTIVLMIGGYMISNILSTGVEASIFSYAMGEVLGLPIPNYFWTVLASVIILIANLRGVDMFAKVQDLVAYLLLGSMLIMGILGVLKMGTQPTVTQPAVINGNFKTVVSSTAVAFWLFIGAEYAIPISKDVKNAKRNVPLGMIIGLGIICVIQGIMVFGFHNYTLWDDLTSSPAPHLLYGEKLLGKPGQMRETIHDLVSSHHSLFLPVFLQPVRKVVPEDQCLMTQYIRTIRNKVYCLVERFVFKGADDNGIVHQISCHKV